MNILKTENLCKTYEKGLLQPLSENPVPGKRRHTYGFGREDK